MFKYQFPGRTDVVVDTDAKITYKKDGSGWEVVQAHVSRGGVIEAAETAQETAKREAEEAKRDMIAADSAIIAGDAKLRALASMSPAEARAWVATNVTNLAEAKDLLGTMAAVLTVLARRTLGV